jgi:hypothetical protein
MAMDGTAMGDAVAAALADVIENSDVEIMKPIWETVCREIVAHIKANAKVPAGIGVSTTGGPSAQTGATTDAGNVL